MNLKDLLASTDIWEPNNDLPVKSTWTKQCLVKHIWSVSGGDYNHAVVNIKTVHFHQELVQCLLTLVMTTTKSSTTLTTNRIDLVNEYNTRCLLLRLLKHIAHAGRADPNKHLYEVRT